MSDRFQIGKYWLSQRPDAETWYITWYDGFSRQTRRKSLGTGDLEEAKELFAQWVLTAGDREQRKAADTELGDVFLRYLHHHGTRIRASGEARRSLELFLEAAVALGVHLVSDLKKANQLLIADRFRDEGRASGYIKRIFGVAKAAVNWAWENGEIDRPIPFIRLQEDNAEKYRVLTPAEIGTLWAAEMPHHVRVFLVLLLGTAARPNAVLDLTREACDLNSGTMDLNPPGKARTKKRRPILPLPGFLRPWIETAPPGPLVQWRGAPVIKINKTWRKVRSAAGLPDYVVPYAIRHTLATEMARQGVPSMELTMWLGHREADTRTTERYLHYRPAYLQNACRVLEDYARTIGLPSGVPADAIPTN